MKHLDFNETPVTRMNYYSSKFNADIMCKRDDLFDKAAGGNKARMLQYILSEVTPSNCDILVTAGGPCSNFNRACALMCAKLGIPMHLIEYTEMPEEFETSLNYYICNLVDIRKTRCNKDNVPQTIKSVMNEYNTIKAKFIYGGGKSLEGIYAYYDAVKELSTQIRAIDHLFVSCGTGTTLTGICAGMKEYYPQAHIHAISVARTYENELPTLLEDMSILNSYLGTQYDFDNMSFYEDYLCGGYDQTSNKLLATVRECISSEGMIVDPCYSGKALYGMIEEIKKSPEQYAGKNILFWNTGGIFNLLSMRNSYEL